MSYIEREAAIEKLKHFQSHLHTVESQHAIGVAIQIIKEIPAAAVRPVVPGHWVTAEEANATGDYAAAYTCSVCGHCDWDCTESESFNYCPNCGAQMWEVTASE